MRRLIEACTEDVLVQHTAATLMKSEIGFDRLEYLAQRRERFIGELNGVIFANGGTAEPPSVAFMKRRSLLDWLGDVIIQQDERAACGASSRVETRTMAAYEAVLLALQLPDVARTVVIRQRAEIARSVGPSKSKSSSGGHATA